MYKLTAAVFISMLAMWLLTTPWAQVVSLVTGLALATPLALLGVALPLGMLIWGMGRLLRG